MRLFMPELKHAQANQQASQFDSCSQTASPQPAKFARVWQALKAMLLSPTELQVWHRCDRDGNVWWYAYDPVTRQSVHHLSEAEMRLWIEQNYYYRAG